MVRDANKVLIERRRYEALKIIAANLRRKRMRDTDEQLLDHEALRQASARASETRLPDDHDWMPAATVCPRPDSRVEFVKRREDQACIGEYRYGEFFDVSSETSWPRQEVTRWRYAD
ncbi:MAG: hypothetical protein ABIS07_02400 [Dokdonella sp.]